jgi:hypothetical protein
MNLRWLCVLLLLCLGAPTAASANEQGVFRRVSCSVVRYYVAKYSMSVAEQWARDKGASEAEIETARRCLRSETTRTARTPPSRPMALGTFSW